MAVKLNSIVFHSSRLDEIRDFYEGILKLPTGTYVKNGETVPDYNESYVNYHIGGALLCFELDDAKTETGTIILNVEDFSGLRARLRQNGITVNGDGPRYFKIQDPEGRQVIIEPSL